MIFDNVYVSVVSEVCGGQRQMSQVREGDSRETRDGLPDRPILAPSFLFSLFLSNHIDLLD